MTFYETIEKKTLSKNRETIKTSFNQLANNTKSCKTVVSDNILVNLNQEYRKLDFKISFFTDEDKIRVPLK